MLTFFLVFLAYFFVDALFVVYMKCVEKYWAIRSGAIAAIMYVLYAYGVVAYAKEPIYILAIALGSFFGTASVVAIQKRLEQENEV